MSTPIVFCSKHGQQPEVDSPKFGKGCKQCYVEGIKRKAKSSEEVFSHNVATIKEVEEVAAKVNYGDMILDTPEADENDNYPRMSGLFKIEVTNIMSKLFNVKTLKSKTFLVGLLQVAGGVFFYSKGNIEIASLLTGLGLTAIVGRDTATKILDKLESVKRK